MNALLYLAAIRAYFLLYHFLAVSLAPEAAKVISSQGEISVPVTLSFEMPAGVVFLPDHFAVPPVNALTLNSNLVRVTIQKG